MKITSATVKIVKIFFWLLLILTLTCITLSITPSILETELISILLRITTVSTIILLSITNLTLLLFSFLLVKKMLTH